MNDADVVPFFATLRDANPEPATELDYTSVFEMLISVLLSAQTTDKRVNQVTKALFAAGPTPAKMLALGAEAIEEMIKPVGFFRMKTKSVLATCRILVEEHGGEVPRTREALEALPGVGRKTANVVLNVAFEELTLAVDTHVFRVANRTGLAPGKDPLEVETKLMKVVPKQYLRNAHHYLILHGRYTCVAKKPLCAQCVIYEPCGFKEKKKFAAPETETKKPKKKSVLPKRGK